MSQIDEKSLPRQLEPVEEPQAMCWGTGCGSRHRSGDGEIRDLSLSRNCLLFFMIKVSGLYSERVVAGGWSGWFRWWWNIFYPLGITANWCWNIVWLVEIEQPPLVVVWVTYYCMMIVMFWYLRYHLMKSLFNCNSVDNEHIANRSIHLPHQDLSRLYSADQKIWLTIIVAGTLFLVQGLVLGYYALQRVLRGGHGLNDAEIWVGFVFSRIGTLYFFLGTMSAYCYLTYIQMLNVIEIRALRGKIVNRHFETATSFIQVHKKLMIRMTRISRDLSMVNAVGLMVLLSRVPVSIFEFNRTGDSEQIIWMLINLAMFTYLCWNIAVVNRMSDCLVRYFHSEQVLEVDDRAIVESYLGHNPAYARIYGYPITESLIFWFYGALGSVILPVIYIAFPWPSLDSV